MMPGASDWGTMPELTFTLSHWAAWAPGISSPSQWAHWAPQHPSSDETPDVSWLPALQRRRLSPLARGVFHVVNEIALQHDVSGLPTVLASRHGEIARTQTLLENIGDQEPLSPAAFSLSVHNAIGGQLSIALGNRQPMSCVALGEEGLGAALLEAVCLQEDNLPVLVLIYDGPLPNYYLPYCASEPFNWAIALLLGGDGPRFRFSRGPASADTALQGPHLAQALAQGDTHIPLPGQCRGWQLERL